MKFKCKITGDILTASELVKELKNNYGYRLELQPNISDDLIDDFVAVTIGIKNHSEQLAANIKQLGKLAKEANK